MLLYPAIFTQGEKYITITFPDIPEAITQGQDQSQAFEMAQEVLGLVLEDYSEYPQATPIQELKKQYPDSDIALVAIDMLAYKKKYQSKKVRKNVTIPEWLNELAEEHNINFSQVLTEALELKLHV
ncbi:type II toxin-antitoxin system HicB family antitoxin [Streptococcus suis]|uniref:type II toxin-antitoxin system HicB family antitoxin n=1 Tax=Streptococcus suis TaxID=1307 RepID=UPI00287FEB18|nr:type II toxin-antitoxin system HicB family antitoxin [Streptococcus suis]WNF71452.1 type II toxin-antitoxin system HicB family antitoxin [Streptococcus suis]HEL1961466.1 type II toxin-antitoxin system HicB family antitoxin [Streptococcus suis]HEL1972258.1 type II toxin-antitoxin system HicB family antitoxin [Streptococcus suis]HEL1974361.1 type II toxin-antitoxin system HicB family antitoxin [Streptococcus suis]HEM4042315.1 type II toxin-antitoxin system HicB family antitoxin [Streptococcus